VDNFYGKFLKRKKCLSWEFKTLGLIVWSFGLETSQREQTHRYLTKVVMVQLKIRVFAGYNAKVNSQ
jgi:hypothetical protein